MNNNYYQNIRNKEQARTKKLITAILIIITITLMFVITALFVRINRESETINRINSGATIKPNIKQTTVSETPIPTQSFSADDDFSIEDEVLKIRRLYNNTQENIQNFTKTVSENGIITYFDNNHRIRMDIPPDDDVNYAKIYYFDNEELYFAFIFDGLKENRLYFRNNKLFRWIDESGVTHDMETKNSIYAEWERIALNDIKR